MDYIKQKLKFISDQLTVLGPYKGRTIQEI